MKKIHAAFILVGTLLSSIASAQGYNGYIAGAISYNTLDYKVPGIVSGDAELASGMLRLGWAVAPYISVELRGGPGLLEREGSTGESLKLNHTVGGMLLLGPTVAQQGFFKPYVVLGWNQSRVTYKWSGLIDASKSHNGFAYGVGATLYGSRPGETSSIWGTRPDIGINLEYIQMIDDTVDIAGVKIDTKLSGLSLGIFKRF